MQVGTLPQGRRHSRAIHSSCRLVCTLAKPLSLTIHLCAHPACSRAQRRAHMELNGQRVDSAGRAHRSREAHLATAGTCAGKVAPGKSRACHLGQQPGIRLVAGAPASQHVQVGVPTKTRARIPPRPTHTPPPRPCPTPSCTARTAPPAVRWRSMPRQVRAPPAPSPTAQTHMGQSPPFTRQGPRWQPRPCPRVLPVPCTHPAATAAPLARTPCPTPHPPGPLQGSGACCGLTLCLMRAAASTRWWTWARCTGRGAGGGGCPACLQPGARSARRPAPHCPTKGLAVGKTCFCAASGAASPPPPPPRTSRALQLEGAFIQGLGMWVCEQVVRVRMGGCWWRALQVRGCWARRDAASRLRVGGAGEEARQRTAAFALSVFAGWLVAGRQGPRAAPRGARHGGSTAPSRAAHSCTHHHLALLALAQLPPLLHDPHSLGDLQARAGEGGVMQAAAAPRACAPAWLCTEARGPQAVPAPVTPPPPRTHARTHTTHVRTMGALKPWAPRSSTRRRKLRWAPRARRSQMRCSMACTWPVCVARGDGRAWVWVVGGGGGCCECVQGGVLGPQ